MKSKLIMVGGFLGSGKTSLLWETARRIDQTGTRVGLITNDQASQLVDTAFLETGANLVKEVSGSCFCCNFNGFVDAVNYIREKNNGGVIVGEPVGSCTDLSATIMQPLKDKYQNEVDLAPLTVLADPFRLKAILQEARTPAQYIVLKQFEEADIILINKIDLISRDEVKELVRLAQSKWADAKVMAASVKTGEGIEEWLDFVLAQDEAGTNITQVDYDIYAEGEAAFGWLNATYEIKQSADFDALSRTFIHNLGACFDKQEIEVGHVKFLLETSDKQIIGSITGKADTAKIRTMDRRSEKTSLTVNARAETDPQTLESIVTGEVNKLFGGLDCHTVALKCLIPGRPNPTYRYDRVIGK